MPTPALGAFPRFGGGVVPSSCSERQTELGGQKAGTAQGPGSAVDSPNLGVGAAAAPEFLDGTPPQRTFPQPSQTPGRPETNSPQLVTGPGLSIGASCGPLPDSQTNKKMLGDHPLHTLGLSPPPGSLWLGGFWPLRGSYCGFQGRI